MPVLIAPSPDPDEPRLPGIPVTTAEDWEALLAQFTAGTRPGPDWQYGTAEGLEDWLARREQAGSN
jgi:hypothetical protein